MLVQPSFGGLTSSGGVGGKCFCNAAPKILVLAGTFLVSRSQRRSLGILLIMQIAVARIRRI
jgi:hypothetical protein